MKKALFVATCALLVFALSCDRQTGERTVLVSKRFLDDNSCEIVCRGFPSHDENPIVREESARRAALLNIYYYARLLFNDTVSPEKDGSVEEVTAGEDAVVVRYVIRKDELKKRLR